MGKARPQKPPPVNSRKDADTALVQTQKENGGSFEPPSSLGYATEP
jgi:hypothetical protein